MSLTTIAFWTIFTYLLASIPFSLLVGKAILGVDIRNFGDGNPGATNVKRAGGSIGLYIVALLLDGFKGLFPVGIPYWIYGWFGYEIVPIAIAALLGHSFSVFLRFNGGKAVAITGGVWIGLLILEAVLVIPTMLTYWYYAVEDDEWAVIFMLCSLLFYLLLTHQNNYPLLLIWVTNVTIVAFNHRHGLKKLPTLRYRRNGAKS